MPSDVRKAAVIVSVLLVILFVALFSMKSSAPPPGSRPSSPSLPSRKKPPADAPSRFEPPPATAASPPLPPPAPVPVAPSRTPPPAPTPPPFNAQLIEDLTSETAPRTPPTACPNHLVNVSLMPLSCAPPELDLFANQSTLLKSSRRYCELAVLEPENICFEQNETFVECHARLNLEPILPPLCRDSQFFRHVRHATATATPSRSKLFPVHDFLGRTWRSQFYERPSVVGSRRAAEVFDSCERKCKLSSAAENNNSLFESCAARCVKSMLLQPIDVHREIDNFDLPVQRVIDPTTLKNVSVVLHHYAVPTSWIPDDALAADRRRFGFKPLAGDMLGWPGRKNPYSSSFSSALDDGVAYSLVRRSWFSIINGRHGFTSSRLIEHLALGVIPIFADLNHCINQFGTECLASMPKDLLLEAQRLPCLAHIFKSPYEPSEKYVSYQKWPHRTFYFVDRNPFVDWSLFNESAVMDLSRRMLQYARRYLSSKALALYLLKALQPPSQRKIRTALVVLCTNQLVDATNLVYGLLELDIHVVLGKTKQVAGWGYKEFLSNFPLTGSMQEFEKQKRDRVTHGRGQGHLFPLHANRELLSECDVGGECERRIAADEFDVAFAFLVHKDPVDDIEYYAQSADLTGWELFKELRDSGMGKQRVMILDGHDTGRMMMPWMTDFATVSRREPRTDSFSASDEDVRRSWKRKADEERRRKR